MPTYLSAVHGLDIKHFDGALFAMFFAGFIGELIGGQIGDAWRARGEGRPNMVFRTLFGMAAIIACLSIFGVAHFSDPLTIVILLCATLFFLRWCGMYWAIPGILASRARSGFLGGCMNLGGNIALESRYPSLSVLSSRRRAHTFRPCYFSPSRRRRFSPARCSLTIAASWRSEAAPIKFGEMGGAGVWTRSTRNADPLVEYGRRADDHGHVVWPPERYGSL
jgi:hypothetical protein